MNKGHCARETKIGEKQKRHVEERRALLIAVLLFSFPGLLDVQIEFPWEDVLWSDSLDDPDPAGGNRLAL